MTNIQKIAAAAFFGTSTFLATILPVAAMPLTRPASAEAAPADVVQVRSSHRRDHRRDHRFHGRDDYYDRNDQSGVLFKSFVTGTLFRPR